MQQDSKGERVKRALRSAGKSAGRSTVGMINWSIGQVLKVLLPVLLVVAAVLAFIWGGGYYWQILRPRWANEQMQSQLQTITRAQIDETNLSCGLRMGWEDGSTNEERLFATIAGYNLSEEMRTSLCDISYKFWTLRAPEHPVFRFAHRPTGLADYFKNWSAQDLAQYGQLKEDFAAYRKDPSTLNAKYPWLSCATRYQRTTYPGLYPHPDKELDEKMKLVFTSPGGAKYFCPK